MSEQIIGVVDSIYTKEVNTKFGPRSVYHATVNGHDVNLGFQTELTEGEAVVLDVEHKYGGYQLIQGGAKKRKNYINTPPAKGPTPKAEPKVVPKKGPAFPIAVNNESTSIIRQSSLNRAVESVHKLMDAGVITAKTEAQYQNKIFEYAYLYTDFGTGQREVKAAAAMRAEEEDA